MRYLFIITLLISIFTQSFSQLKEKISDKIASFDTNPRQSAPNSEINSLNKITLSKYSQQILIEQSYAQTKNPQAQSFLNLESGRVQGTSGSSDGTFTPFKGIVIGYNYVCITKGAWQWESGRLKYFFTSRLTGSIKAKIKYFKFDNVEINLNLKLN